MKKMILCFAVLLATVLTVRGEEVIGRVTEKIGVVEVQPGNSKEWRALSVKDNVYAVDTLRTGADGRVKIFFVDDSVVTLGVNTTVCMEELTMSSSKSSRRGVIRVFMGSMKFHLRRKFASPSRFEIHTPTAIAGAKGTSGYVLVPSPHRTVIIMTGGVMEVHNVNADITGSVTVGRGFATVVELDTPPGEPAPVTGEERRSVSEEFPAAAEDGDFAEPPSEQVDDVGQSETPASDGSGESGMLPEPGVTGDVMDQPMEDVVIPLPAPPVPPAP